MHACMEQQRRKTHRITPTKKEAGGEFNHQPIYLLTPSHPPGPPPLPTHVHISKAVLYQNGRPTTAHEALAFTGATTGASDNSAGETSNNDQRKQAGTTHKSLPQYQQLRYSREPSIVRVCATPSNPHYRGLPTVCVLNVRSLPLNRPLLLK